MAGEEEQWLCDIGGAETNDWNPTNQRGGMWQGEVSTSAIVLMGEGTAEISAIVLSWFC